MKVRIVGTLKQAGRCAFCHDSLEALGHPCGGCGTWLHLDCWEEIKVCTSPGCEEKAPAREGTTASATPLEGRAHLRTEDDLQAWAREALERRLYGPGAVWPYLSLISSLAGYLLVLGGLCAWISWGLSEGIPGAWRLAKPGDAPLLSMLGIVGPTGGVTLALAYHLLLALAKWPKAWSDSHSLLRETRPEPRRMRVWVESAGDKPQTFAAFERLSGSPVPGMAKVRLDRFFISPPRWLFEPCEGKPVLVYGLGTGEPPFLVEDASGQLALIHA